jgi:hypothetical protein
MSALGPIYPQQQTSSASIGTSDLGLSGSNLIDHLVGTSEHRGRCRTNRDKSGVQVWKRATMIAARFALAQVS